MNYLHYEFDLDEGDEVVAPPASSVEDALEDAMLVLARMTGYPAVANLPGARRDTMPKRRPRPKPSRRPAMRWLNWTPTPRAVT